MTLEWRDSKQNFALECALVVLLFRVSLSLIGWNQKDPGEKQVVEMLHGKLLNRLNIDLRLIPKREKYIIRRASIVCALISALNVIVLIATLPGGGVWGVYIDYTYIWKKESISLALMINAIVAYPFRAKRYLISLVMLIWVVGEYAFWLIQSVEFLQQLDQVERETLTKPIIAGFYEANWVDILILVITVFLLAWAVRTSLSIFRPPLDGAGTSIGSESQVQE